MLTLDVLLRESKMDADRIERLHTQRTFEPKEIGEAIDALREKQRLVLALRLYENLTIAEIATILGIKTDKVTVLLARATETLCGILEKALPENEARGNVAAGGSPS